MTLKTILFTCTFLWIVHCFLAQITEAKGANSTQVRVILLGQPCVLKGPFDESTLKMIHSIGPAQVSTHLDLAAHSSEIENAKKEIDTIRKAKNLPSLLDRYREKLLQRLDAQIRFLSALSTFKKSNSTSEFEKVGKDFLDENSLIKFNEIIKKLNSSLKGTPAKGKSSETWIEQLYDYFNEEIPPNPESDYHHAIKKLNIQYQCSFEETDEE